MPVFPHQQQINLIFPLSKMLTAALTGLGVCWTGSSLSLTLTNCLYLGQQSETKIMTSLKISTFVYK